jgi:hypothetical protein
MIMMKANQMYWINWNTRRKPRRLVWNRRIHYMNLTHRKLRATDHLQRLHHIDSPPMPNWRPPITPPSPNRTITEVVDCCVLSGLQLNRSHRLLIDDVMNSADACTILAQIPLIFYVGENCTSIGTLHNTTREVRLS